jgi:hypothetical protein
MTTFRCGQQFGTCHQRYCMRGGANDQLANAAFAAWFGVSTELVVSLGHWDAHGTSYACFSFLCRVARELTQGSAERNQFCRRGTKSRRWRKIPTRTM